jgi:hypothetical protein
MAKASNLLGRRVNVRNVSDGRHAIRVDGVTVAFLLGESGTGFVWEERMEIGARKRVDATDAVLRVLIQSGEIDPHAPARDLRAEADIPDHVKEFVRARDSGICQYCLIQGRETPGEVYDHFIPAGEGGKGSVDNVQLACAPCNRKKWHHRPQDLFRKDWKLWGPGQDRSGIVDRSW